MVDTLVNTYCARVSTTPEGNVRYYVDDNEGVKEAVVVMQELLRRPEVRPLISFDTETAPLPGLEGYPGARRELVTLEDGTTEERFVKASKGEYLLFTQRVWKAAFNPSSLRELGLFLPVKTTSGKEGDLDAKEAWRLFLGRVYELEATEEGRVQLEAARWNARCLSDYAYQLSDQIVGLWEDYEVLQAALRTKQEVLVAGKKVTGIKTLETKMKRLKGQWELLEAERAFLDAEATPRLDEPVFLELLTHVLKVAAEGRVYLTAGGRNRMDPVQPGLDPYTSTIFLAQFTLAEHSGRLHSWVINCHKADLGLLRPLFQLKRVCYVGANLKFDLKLLMHSLGGVLEAPRDVICTAITSRLLNLGLGNVKHSLAGAAKNFLGRDLDKLIRDDFIGRRMDEPTAEMLEYSYTDTEVLPALLDAQFAVAREFGQEELTRTFSRLSWITAVWEYKGYRLDQDQWLPIAAEAAQARDDAAHQLEAMLLPPGYVAITAATAGDAEDDEEPSDDEDGPAKDNRRDAVIRISQGKLVLEQMQRLLGFDPALVCPNGKPSLSKDARSAMEREYRSRHGGEAHPFFYQYALWSKRAKQASTYGKRFLWYRHPISGNIHPTFHIAGTDTGRYSSTAPNFLNIPAAKEDGDPDFRGAFLAEEGNYLLGGDMEAMELRIAGDITRDPLIKAMVESGADAHSFTAAMMFHVRRERVIEPQRTTTGFRYGTTDYTIDLFLVPEAWTTQQVADFALSTEVQAAVAAVPKKQTRTVAKMVGFLWLFRGTPYTLAQRTGLSLELCEDFFARFKVVYSTMDGEMSKIAERVYTHVVEGDDGTRFSWSEGYGGIRRWAELPHNPEMREYRSHGVYLVAAKQYKREMGSCMREMANLPMQGGNAVATAEALLEAVERGHRLGVLPWLAVYDEIIATAPDHVSPTRVKAILEGSVLDVCDRYMKFVPAGFEADVKKAGKHWVKS